MVEFEQDKRQGLKTNNYSLYDHTNESLERDGSKSQSPSPSVKPYFLKSHWKWILLILISVVWSSYAIYLGAMELMRILGYTIQTKPRAVPLLFIVHSFMGPIPLISGALLANGYILGVRRSLHKKIGLLYVIGSISIRLSNVPLILNFNQNSITKIAMFLLSLSWLTTTLFGYKQIRQKKILSHSKWMIRSFAHAFFFVSFSFWIPIFQVITTDSNVYYPLSVVFGWIVNIFVTEFYLHGNFSLSKVL